MFESVRRAFGFIHAYLRAFATLPVILYFKAVGVLAPERLENTRRDFGETDPKKQSPPFSVRNICLFCNLLMSCKY